MLGLTLSSSYLCLYPYSLSWDCRGCPPHQLSSLFFYSFPLTSPLKRNKDICYICWEGRHIMASWLGCLSLTFEGLISKGEISGTLIPQSSSQGSYLTWLIKLAWSGTYKILLLFFPHADIKHNSQLSFACSLLLCSIWRAPVCAMSFIFSPDCPSSPLIGPSDQAQKFSYFLAPRLIHYLSTPLRQTVHSVYVLWQLF